MLLSLDKLRCLPAYMMMDACEADGGISCCEQADSADAEVVLDDGRTYKVHAVLLAMGSSVLSDVVQLASKQPKQKRLRIPFPFTTGDEALALINLLYKSRPESHASGLSLEQLCLLSSVCSRFSFEDILILVDEILAKQSGDSCPEELQAQPDVTQILTPENAAAMYWDARAKGLYSFETACATYIGKHVRQVAEASPHDALGPVLIQAAKHSFDQQQLQAITTELEQGLQQISCIGGNGLIRLTATQLVSGALDRINAMG